MRFRKVVVVGLDGLDPVITSNLMATQQLPNLASLSENLQTRRLATTYPAQTPVAWSTFATGVNPGGHGVYDFIRREIGTYVPTMALNRFEQKNRFLPPKAVNLRRGTTLWETLGNAGISSTILRCPCTFPPDTLRGRMLSGMGVPDLMGGFGNSTHYTTDGSAVAGEAETVEPLHREGNDYRSDLLGPRHPRTRERIRIPIKFRHRGPGLVLLSNGTPREMQLQERQWSDWLHVKFPVGPFQSVRGMVRFLLLGREPELAIQTSPVNFDPEAPLFPISHPDGYSRELAGEIGPYHTSGMVEDHAGLSNGRLDESLFLEHCASIFQEREQMLHRELSRLDEGLLYCLFDTPDRLQHMFWRFREPDHPANRAGAPKEFASAIDDMYRHCDQIVGRVLAAVDKDTLLIVLSDHGFGSFQRGLNLNSWLWKNGFLSLQPGILPGDETVEGFRGVNWGKTRAYALGLGSIYLNKSGREPEGAVSGDEEAEVLSAIMKGLSGLRDTERGRVGVRRVVRATDVYRGAYLAEAPDLVVLFENGYRASWKTALGGISDSVWEDNTKKWSGDHIFDPEIVPGVLFANCPLHPRSARMLDMAPTILAALGLSAPSYMEGTSLLP